ncbi:MAG: hypothetical protein E7585_06290 [Ruminococcaceae bacterium]|nr:hypothetical protein [Oscillospiraceae bacterium]
MENIEKQEERVAKRLVEIQFDSHDSKLSYLCKIENIEVGDLVTVDGKLEDQIGTVTKVLKAFKTPKFEMKWVTAVLNRDLTGEYRKIGDDIVSLGGTLTSEKFCTMYIGERYKGNEGIGEADLDIDLATFEESGFIDDELVMLKGKDYYKHDRVAYISLQNGMGKAYVIGSEWYEIDFKYEDGKVTYIACECPYFGNCKHIVAVLFKLREMLKKIRKIDCGANFTACRKECFNHLLTAAKGRIVLDY